MGEAKMKAAMAGGKGKKKKWSKVKVKENANNLVLFDAATLQKLEKEMPKTKLITPAVVSERLKVNGSVARLGIKILLDKGEIKAVARDHKTLICTRASVA